MAGLPEFAIAFGPVGNVLERTRFERAEMPAAARGFGDETGALEISEVFGDSLLGDREKAGDLLDRGGALCEAEKYGATRGVGECSEGGAKSIHNHMVVDCGVVVKGIFLQFMGLAVQTGVNRGVGVMSCHSLTMARVASGASGLYLSAFAEIISFCNA